LTPAVAVKPATPEAPKPEPTKIVEVIDLARAYEPVREPEEPAGGVNPAAFIEIPEAPKQIPPAIELDDPIRDVIEAVKEAQTGGSLFGAGMPPAERLDVMPREVATIQNGLLNFVPTSPASGEPTSTGAGQLVFTPMCVPYATGVTQAIPPGASIAPPTEVLRIMPREVK
jgi:hypothetical protein